MCSSGNRRKAVPWGDRSRPWRNRQPFLTLAPRTGGRFFCRFGRKAPRVAAIFPRPGQGIMRLSTRLLLPLLAAITAVMAVFAWWAQKRRESTMLAEARRETEAFATAFGVALEGAFRHSDPEQVQELVDRLSQEPSVYAVLVYDTLGVVLFASRSLPLLDAPPLGLVRQALATDGRVSLERKIWDEEVYSVLRPFRGEDGAVVGVYEVAQPLVPIRAEVARTRQRFLLNTFVLLVAVAGLTSWLVRRLVSRPLERFSRAVESLGSGDLSHRIQEELSTGELAEVARQLNRMADRLEAARKELLAESEERVALERRLQASERLAAVGNLAARLAHEIAAPLHVIRGRADLLLKGDRGPEDRARQLRIIVEQIDRITVIVRNLLSFARRPEPRIQRVDLAALLTSVLEFLEPELRRAGIELEWNSEPAPMVEGDPDLLFQVFTNLLLNAIQAMEEQDGGRRLLAVHLENDPLSPPGEKARWVRVRVEDTGPGIPEELLPSIFEPFVTTKRGAAGTGLGLAVAKAAVEQMGGVLVAENLPFPPETVGREGRKWRGARFSVVLKAAKGGGELG